MSHKDKVKDFLRKNVVLIIVIVFFLILHHILVSPLIALPSPVHGGDLYFQLGQTEHVRSGGSPFHSSTVNDALPGYFVLYSAITGNIAGIFNMDSISAEFLFSYVVIILSAIIMFVLTKKLFKNDLLAVISCLVFISGGTMPTVKYTEFALLVMIPLFLYLLYNFINDFSVKKSILLGLVYGLIGLTHSVAFISSSFLLLAVFIYYSIKPVVKEKKLYSKDIKKILPYVIVIVIGVAIALLWWYKPLFVHHAQTSLHYTEWNNQNWASLSFQLDFLTQTIKNNFLNFANFRSIIFSIFTLFGLAGMVLIKNKTKEMKYIQFLFISSLIIVFHYLITQNFLNTNFIPDYMASLLLGPVLVLLFVFGVYFSAHLMKRLKLQNKIYFAAIILLLLATQIIAYDLRTDDRWYVEGLNEVYPHMYPMQEYIFENTDVYDVFLTTNELGFALNAFTGRKLITTRRAQSDPFLEMDPRVLDAALILYGNNTELRKELIEKYDIKYIYWDFYWFESEFTLNEQGEMVSLYDPMLLFYSEETEEILKENGVKYFIETYWVDPALRSEDYKKFKLIFISYENYRAFETPWIADLDPYLEEVWRFDLNGELWAKIFKIDLEEPMYSSVEGVV